MSWDKIEYDEFAECKCGKGKVIRRICRQDDDWNRTREECIGEKIDCPECSIKYHIEHHIRHYSCMPWDGDGISDRVFLVPNGIKIPDVKTERCFSFHKLDETIVANIDITDIKAAINDMKENRYTTRLKLCSSKEIVRLYQKRYKKKCLNLIVPFLEKIVQNYNNYEWTLESIEEYRKTERKSIAENKKEIEQAIGLSFELVFGRNRL